MSKIGYGAREYVSKIGKKKRTQALIYVVTYIVTYIDYLRAHQTHPQNRAECWRFILASLASIKTCDIIKIKSCMPVTIPL